MRQGTREEEDQVRAEDSSQLCVSGLKEELNSNFIKILNFNSVFSNGKTFSSACWRSLKLRILQSVKEHHVPKSLWHIQKASNCSEATKKELVIATGEAGGYLYLQQVAANSTGHQHGVDNPAKRKEKRDQVWCCDWPQGPQGKTPQQTRTSSTLIIWKMTQRECSGFSQLSKLQRLSSAGLTQLCPTKFTKITVNSSKTWCRVFHHWGWMHTINTFSSADFYLNKILVSNCHF